MLCYVLITKTQKTLQKSHTKIFTGIFVKDEHIPKAKKKWTLIYKEIENVSDETWKIIYKMAFIRCRDTKLQSFQY